VNHALRSATSASVAIVATSPLSTMTSALEATTIATANSPNGISRPLERTLPRALKGIVPCRARRSVISDALVSTSITAIAIP
jgi:hypothetical protein